MKFELHIINCNYNRLGAHPKAKASTTTRKPSMRRVV